MPEWIQPFEKIGGFKLTPRERQGHREAADQYENAAGGFENNNVACGLATGLKDLGLREEDIGRAVDVVAKRKFPNPLPLTTTDIDNVIRRALAGAPPRF